MVFTKENKHPFGGGLLVDDTSSDLALPSSIFQCIGFIGQRDGHHRGRKDVLNGLGALQRGQALLTSKCCNKHIASETHGHSVSFLASASDSDRWSIRRGLETRYRAISMHNIHPTPLEPIESTCLLLHVVTGHVLWFRTSKGSDAKNVQRMMGALWSAAPQYAVQCQCGGQ
ncbi:hypothetical protein TNCV_3523801 [Trichonephila clavipes]|uniref:Uncharacterized protein n=1 Tax=Trichonephila clavipes TaxID=2585209 RepID=A0A8X6S496_TRICX|nr:hypothetical protein TNCV_3523801 [Trichonephila clavipes]